MTIARPQRTAFHRQRNFYAAIATEAMAPLLRVLALATSGAPADPSQWRRGVIISHSHIGDVLYRTCSLGQLASGLPECRWTFLTTPGGEEVLRGNPWLSEILVFPEGRRNTKAIRASLRGRFDVALCSNVFGVGADLLLALRAAIPNRVAFTFKGWSGLVTHPARASYPEPYPALFRQMVASVCHTQPDWPLRPHVVCSPADVAAAERALKAARVIGDFWVCAPSSRQQGGVAPMSLFLRVAAAVQADCSLQVAFVGQPGDRNVLLSLARHVPRSTTITDLPSARALCALLGRSRGALTQDSGPRHLANAAAVPVAFFRNLAVHRTLTGRYCDTETDLSGPGEVLTQLEARTVHESSDALQLAEIVCQALRLQ